MMGYRRGGLYSYDWLDRLFGFLDAPSAERVLPEHQRLAVGDVIPIGPGDGFPVAAIEPQRSLVLGGETDGFQWVWQFGLYPLDDRRTRLVSRNRARLPRTLESILFMCALEPGGLHHDAADAARSQAPGGRSRGGKARGRATCGVRGRSEWGPSGEVWRCGVASSSSRCSTAWRARCSSHLSWAISGPAEIAVFTGSILILIVAATFISWIRPARVGEAVAVGIVLAGRY